MPLIQFLIGGVQKGGTSALTRQLANRPDVHFPGGKEAHVFDNIAFDDSWSAERIDEEHESLQACHRPTALHGDATPIYVYHPRLISRILRYNPAMKWIILLRDPVDRALSHYYMVRNRGDESLPLWAALLAEPLRLRGRRDDFSLCSPMRVRSYVARGRYLRQLDDLYAHFPVGQILLVRSQDLLGETRACKRRDEQFLGLPEFDYPPGYERVFVGNYQGRRHPLARWALRQLFRSELAQLRARHGVHFDPDP